jgi:hypothetical protein
MLKKKFGWLILFFLLLGLACQLNPVSPGEEAAGFRRFFVTATPAPTPPPEDLTPYYQTMKPDHVGDIDQVLAQKVTRYWIELLVTPDSLTPPAAPELIGSMRVQYTNREPVLINQVYFRLFPNTPSYEGSMTVNNVIVDNQPVQTTLVADGSALFVPLHRALNTGESTEIVMTYRATVPVTTRPGNGLFT